LNQLQTLKDCLFHQIYCAHLGAELLQLSAQSLIGSPSTLVPIAAATWNCYVSMFFVVSVSRREASSV